MSEETDREFDGETSWCCGGDGADGQKPDVPVRWAEDLEEHLDPDRGDAADGEVCRLDEDRQRRRYREVLEPLLERAVDQTLTEERMELVFEPDRSLLRAITAFVDVERRCCPLVRFELEIEADGGPIRLTTEVPEEFDPGPMEEEFRRLMEET